MGTPGWFDPKDFSHIDSKVHMLAMFCATILLWNVPSAVFLLPNMCTSQSVLNFIDVYIALFFILVKLWFRTFCWVSSQSLVYPHVQSLCLAFVCCCEIQLLLIILRTHSYVQTQLLVPCITFVGQTNCVNWFQIPCVWSWISHFLLLKWCVLFNSWWLNLVPNSC